MLNSVANTITYLKAKGGVIFHTQVTRAAQKGGTQKGWEFTFQDPSATPPSFSMASTPTTPSTSMVSYFRPTSALPMCACCGNKLVGDISVCTRCTQKVHTLCMQEGQCFTRVCRVCNATPTDDMARCKTCKHRVHVMCAIRVSFRVEMICKICTPNPPSTTSTQPTKKK